MPLIGAHVSIAGGIANAPANAAAEGCECFQMFTRSPRGSAAPPLTDATVAAFRDACATARQSLWVVHTPYYLNLASANARVRRNSGRIIREELERASAIGATYCMTHLGSAREVGVEEAQTLVVEELRRALDGYDGACRFLIEIAAGAGAIIGGQFEEVAEILERVGDVRVGVCFDTQHAFGAGYDLRTPNAVDATLRAFDRTIGLRRLAMSHIQDSKVECGAQKDRHEHIGAGEIGSDGLRAFVRHPAVAALPLILETDSDGRNRDIASLKEFRNA